jgi:hypothetical protein
MPFIQGRYYINRVLGEAQESAREAEAALAALEEPEQEEGGNEGASDQGPVSGPIHRLEIEAAEMVPSHSGRGERGYVARVHRKPAVPEAAGQADDVFASHGGSLANAMATRAARAPHPETRVFNNHDDLLSFLRDELAKDQSE